MARKNKNNSKAKIKKQQQAPRQQQPKQQQQEQPQQELPEKDESKHRIMQATNPITTHCTDDAALSRIPASVTTFSTTTTTDNDTLSHVDDDDYHHVDEEYLAFTSNDDAAGKNKQNQQQQRKAAPTSPITNSTAPTTTTRIPEGAPSQESVVAGSQDGSSVGSTSSSNSRDASTSSSPSSNCNVSQKSSTSSSTGSCIKRQEYKPRKRYFFFGMVLWIATLIALKHSGVITDDFCIDEAVVQKYAAPVQETFDKHFQRIWPLMEQSLARLNESLTLHAATYTSLSYLTQETTRPGFKLAQQGAVANYPVVMVPGFITSGLEVWGGKECARKHFRQRLWAAVGGARSFITERDCWGEHMMLDPWTGGDPPGIRVRASEGFTAADYFMANFWVWGKIIENLADLGYTPSNMALEAYDWRLSFSMLEERDGYFTKLKAKLESFKKQTGKKNVLVCHSMGALVVHYFMAWVTTPEEEGGGGGGKDWVDQHIQSYVNIAGSHLGVPKAAGAILSGEMSDTVLMGPIGQVIEHFFGKKFRRDLWASWGSLWSMLPRGGNAIWGPGADMCRHSDSRSKDDPFCPLDTTELSPLLAVTETGEQEINATIASCKNNASERNESMDDCKLTANTIGEVAEKFASKEAIATNELLQFLQDYGSGMGPNIAAVKQHSLYGDEEKLSSRVWHDPSRTPLPHAPNMKIYCLYGVGLPTERAYYYKRNRGVSSSEVGVGGALVDPPLVLDHSIQHDDQNVTYGIRYTDGDGTVPLVSLGYLCGDAWRREDSGLNPSNIPVITREYKDRKEFSVDDPMRSGPYAADHVDVLGNILMTDDLLRVVSDFEPATDDLIVSDILQIAEEINAHPNGGIKLKQQQQQQQRRKWLQLFNRRKRRNE